MSRDSNTQTNDKQTDSTEKAIASAPEILRKAQQKLHAATTLKELKAARDILRFIHQFF